MTGRWGVAGGGVLGLTIALRLAEAGEKVDVVEAAPAVGGLAAAKLLEGDLAGVEALYARLDLDGGLARTVGIAAMSIGMSRSRTIRSITLSCW